MKSNDPNYFHVFTAEDFKKLTRWLDLRNYTHFNAENLINKNNKPLVSLRERTRRDDGRLDDQKRGIICFESHSLRDEALPLIKANLLAKKYS